MDSSINSKYQRYRDCRLELNLTFQEIQNAFENQPHQPYRISRRIVKDHQFIELSFVNPDIGHLYDDMILEIQEWTLWDIQVKSAFNEKLIFSMLKNTIPKGYDLVRSPSFYRKKRIVSVTVQPAMKPEVLQDWDTLFRSQTGLEITLKNKI